MNWFERIVAAGTALLIFLVFKPRPKRIREITSHTVSYIPPVSYVRAERVFESLDERPSWFNILVHGDPRLYERFLLNVGRVIAGNASYLSCEELWTLAGSLAYEEGVLSGWCTRYNEEINRVFVTPSRCVLEGVCKGQEGSPCQHADWHLSTINS